MPETSANQDGNCVRGRTPERFAANVRFIISYPTMRQSSTAPEVLPTVTPFLIARLGLVALLCIVAACDWPGDRTPQAVGSTTPGDTAAQLAFGTRLTLTDSGVARARLHADSAYIHDDGLRFDLRRVHVLFVDSTGDSLSAMFADRGWYDVRSGVLDVSGSVSIVGAAARTLQTTHTVYDPAANVLRSDSSYTFTQGTPARQSAGQGFESEPRLTGIGRSRARP